MDTGSRKYGDGSVFQRKRGDRVGMWVARVAIPGVGYRSYTARTKEEAEAGLLMLRGQHTRPGRPRRAPLIGESPERHTSRRFYVVRRVLEMASTEGWVPDFTAHVIVASLTPSRVIAGVFGPCVYCGSWLAATVDHVLPKALGGSDDRANLVSACRSCNSAKNDRPPDSWQL